MKCTIQLIGIGSPEASDQIGWAIIEALSETSKLKPYLNDYLYCHQLDRPGVKLLTTMFGADIVFLFDAVKSDKPTGTIISANDVSIYSEKNLWSTHGFGVAEAIHLGKILNSLPPSIYFYGIVINEINPNLKIIKQSIADMTKLIEEKLLAYLPALT